MGTLNSIVSALPNANRGVGALDKVKSFFLIAFETTAHTNLRRRSITKQILRALSENGVLRVALRRYGHKVVFELRVEEDGDLSVASEFIRAGYHFPRAEPRQIIDGGANIGLFAVVAASRYPAVTVECFEANPLNLQLLQRNLEINHANARVAHKALWSRDSELVFHQHMAFSGYVSEARGAEAEDTIRVPAVLPEIRDDCWMKLDIEGAEYEVLPALLAAGRYPRWISAELHFYREKGPLLVALLREHGYDVSYVPEVASSDMVELFAQRAAGAA